MAFDFPASPSDGAVYTPAGGPSYTYTNGVWRVLPVAQTAMSTASISDTPPGNPVHGQIWWESDTGSTFIYYNDGNTSQWVQQSDVTLPEAPSDGNFYTRSNGAWVAVPRYQRFDAAGLTNVPITVPANANGCRIAGMLWQNSTSSTYLILQVSVSAGVWLGGGSYYTNGWYHYTIGAPNAITGIVNNTSYLGMMLSLTHDSAAVPAQFDGILSVKRPRAPNTSLFSADIRGVSLSSTSGFMHGGYQSYVTGAATGSVTTLLAVRVVPNAAISGNWDVGSFVAVEWF